jgi:ADP-ribosylglycohydrolase
MPSTYFDGRLNIFGKMDIQAGFCYQAILFYPSRTATIRYMSYRLIERPSNRSKGCGGVMRVAPIGLFFCDRPLSIDYSDRIAAEAAAITHGHELGWLPAAALAHIIRRLAENEDETIINAVLDSANALRCHYPHLEHLTDLLNLIHRERQRSRCLCCEKPGTII